MLASEVRHTLLTRSQAHPRTRVLLRVLLAGIAGFVALTGLIRTKEVEAIDHAIAARLQAIRAPWFERAMVAVSWFGFPPQSRVLPLIYAAVLWVARFRLEAVFQLAAWGTALLSEVTKGSCADLARSPARTFGWSRCRSGGRASPAGTCSRTWASTAGWRSWLTAWSGRSGSGPTGTCGRSTSGRSATASSTRRARSACMPP